MTIQERGPSRKQRFEAALKLRNMTVHEWRTSVHRVSGQHLNEVWKHDTDPSTGREPSAELDAAIDDFITDTFARFAPTAAGASE